LARAPLGAGHRTNHTLATNIPARDALDASLIALSVFLFPSRGNGDRFRTRLIDDPMT